MKTIFTLAKLIKLTANHDTGT